MRMYRDDEEFDPFEDRRLLLNELDGAGPYRTGPAQRAAQGGRPTGGEPMLPEDERSAAPSDAQAAAAAEARAAERAPSRRPPGPTPDEAANARTGVRPGEDYYGDPRDPGLSPERRALVDAAQPPQAPGWQGIRQRHDPSYTPPPPAGRAVPRDAQNAEAVEPEGPDQSGWNTNGYETPQFTAENFGNAPPGWDQAKWLNPNHQSPKYVVGRILASNGNMADQASRDAAIAQIQQAYPGTTFDGKDKVTIPGVGTVDIFTNASTGEYGMAWQPLDENGGAASSPAGMGTGPLGGLGAPGAGGGGLIPMQWTNQQEFLRKMMELLGMDGAANRAALMDEMR